MSRFRGFWVLLCFAVLSQATSYGVERLYSSASSHYLSSSENPSRHLFINGKLDERGFDAEQNSAAVFEAAEVLVVLKRYCLAANVFLQVLLAAFFCFFLFGKRERK